MNQTRTQLHDAGRVHLQPLNKINGRRNYACTFLVPGYVKTTDGSDSNWLIPADTVRSAAGLFDGVAVYVDHPEIFGFGFRGEPQVKNLAGVTFGAHYDDTAADGRGALVGGISLYDEDPNSPGAFVGALLDQMLADKDNGIPVPSTGLSAVFYHEAEFDEDTGTRITTRFKHVESVDVVYAPGAGGYVREALAALRLSSRHPPAQIPAQSDIERSSTMPPEENRNRSAADEGAQGAHVQDHTELAVRIDELSARLDALTHDLEGTPEVPAEQSLGVSAHTLEDLHAQIQHLTNILASQERPVQGMGQPRESVLLPGRLQVSDPIDQLQAAWDWIFGVDGAQLPPPELRRTDYLYRLLSGDLTWSGVFNQREALAAASTSTLADMAVNAMNKVIIALYNRLDHYRWFEPLVSVQPTDGSLHDMSWIQFGGIGDLPIVAEGAAYTELTVGDTRESDAFTKYGGYVGITDKVLRNSELARIQAIPRALVVSAIQTRSAKIAAIFTSNSGVGPTLDQDSTALFHSNHSNLATTAFSWTAWKAARLECMKHAELTSSKRMGLPPKFCLVPHDLYDDALQAFGYGGGPGGQPGTGNNDVNPYQESRPGDPRPVPIAVPDWTDANDWAYLVDPMLSPVIQMAYADNPGGQGHPPPQLYSVTSPTAGLMFTNDVLPIKVRDYWAYGVATYRGIGKRNVT